VSPSSLAREVVVGDEARSQIRGAAAALSALIGLSVFGGARAQTLSGQDLVRALQRGGYVIVMRHASAPLAPPSAAEADAGNPGRERQLDAAGRQSAQAMGAAIRRLRIPIDDVWSSPTYRARETVRLAGLPAPKTASELGDNGASMQALAQDQPAWLRAKASQPPRRGTDSLIVTHAPNISAAFGREGANLSDGEALVFRPVGHGQAELIAHVKIEAWPTL
jgi:phosphohistidine phosphatase SixA